MAEWREKCIKFTKKDHARYKQLNLKLNLLFINDEV
jgi:hypothetical protein